MSHWAAMEEYRRERAELAKARAKARREHPQPCDCPYCISPRRADELIRARVTAMRRILGEPPF